MKYMRATTTQIANVLEQHGAQAQLGLPRTSLRSEGNLFSPGIPNPGDGAKIVFAYQLAIDRLREQENRIQELEEYLNQ